MNELNREIYDYYVHFRKVNWIITDQIEFDSQIFDLRTLSPINKDKWQKIKEAYIKKDQKFIKIFDRMEGSIEESINIRDPLELIFNKLPIAQEKMKSQDMRLVSI